ncbi:restriction endonuclease [Streptomyces sp. AV19]|uniref:restriction endonuclease n=1 Tax=Streptomyces sp. AV19 TaxID=2793068 RepID=UPI0018FE0DAF|nr:restriction endonuclease [Streptomyces sp. AV19]MBH1934844.1 restriction endonuclease [Streptomyces sp. AV19]MDG4536975.1 restriction endonuclease [Streptomyces sp. AV19]
MSRRPARRTRRRRPARRSGKQDERVVLLVAVIAAVGLAAAAVQWLLAHWWVLAVVASLAVGAGGLWCRLARQRAEWNRVRARSLRLRMTELDGLDHRAFEFAIRDLMRRDGCRAERLGGAGDNACDVRAVDPAGRVWAVQCKHRRDGDGGSAVGVGVLQQVNGTAWQIHGADVAVVLTNGRFSSKAVPWAGEHRIHLVDRRVLGEWAAGSRPLWDLLDRIPPPRRPTALS